MITGQQKVLLKDRAWSIGLRGFTLIELMVTIAIVAILATVAAPSFNEAILSSRLTAFTNSFAASAQLARSEAIKRNSTVRLCRSANGTSCANSSGWQQGWIIFHDINGDSVVDINDAIIQYQQSLATGYQLTGNSYNIAFRSIGSDSTTATLTLCRVSPVGSQERVVAVSATGRTTVKKTSTGVCT